MRTSIRSILLCAGLIAGGAVAGPFVLGGSDSGPVAQAAIAPAGAYFVPIASYRTMDTREQGDGSKLGRSVDSFDGIASAVFVQFELDGPNAIQFPDEAVAVTYNVTITETEGGGFVQVDGFAFASGATSTVNWSGNDQTAANSGVAQLTTAFDEPGALGVFIGGTADARAHVVLDITGYYMPLQT